MGSVSKNTSHFFRSDLPVCTPPLHPAPSLWGVPGHGSPSRSLDVSGTLWNLLEPSSIPLTLRGRTQDSIRPQGAVSVLLGRGDWRAVNRLGNLLWEKA